MLLYLQFPHGPRLPLSLLTSCAWPSLGRMDPAPPQHFSCPKIPDPCIPNLTKGMMRPESCPGPEPRDRGTVTACRGAEHEAESPPQLCSKPTSASFLRLEPIQYFYRAHLTSLFSGLSCRCLALGVPKVGACTGPWDWRPPSPSLLEETLLFT